MQLCVAKLTKNKRYSYATLAQATGQAFKATSSRNVCKSVRVWVCVFVSCVLSGLAMFFTFRSDAINFRPHTTRTHTNAGTCINYTYATLLAAAAGKSLGQLLWHTHTHRDTHTLVAVALLNFQTHAKLNPRMCLTFALFWLSGPRVFSPLASMLSVCEWVCTRVVSSLLRSFIRHFFLASFTTQLSRSNSRHETRDSTLQLLFLLTRFSFSLYPLCKNKKKIKANIFTCKPPPTLCFCVFFGQK